MKPYIIAELSGNHGGKLENMLKLVEAASTAGCSAIKLQTYKPEDFTEPGAHTIKEGLWKGRDLFELYQEGMTPWEWHKEIFDLARSLNLDYFSTPFSLEAVDFLEDLNVSRYKIASFEILYLPLIKKAASTGKPIIISTGMAESSDISAAVATAAPYTDNITVLKCTSSYPAPLEDANIAQMKELRNYSFLNSGGYKKVNVGLSDHTEGPYAAAAAVANGATVIEKHFCLNKKTGVDAAFSATPLQMKNLVDLCNGVYTSLGSRGHGPAKSELKNLSLRRKFNKEKNKWLRGY